MKLENYNDYKEYSVKIYDISMSMSVLNWDQETKMPKNGSRFRAQQLSTLAKIAYELSTDENYGKLLETLNNDESLNSDQKRNIFLSRKEFLKNKKYSSEFIVKQSKLISKAFNDWRFAKERNDFKLFHIRPLPHPVQQKGYTILQQPYNLEALHHQNDKIDLTQTVKV